MNQEQVKLPTIKRVFDLVMSTFILLLASPMILMIVIVSVLEQIFIPSSRGPILYHEMRISRGEPFTFYKFRIFKVASIDRARSGSGVVHTKELERDPQALTLVGRPLKQVYLDELPQLINVFKGDMTLVGPRPTNMENSEKLRTEGHLSKYLMKAGITGYFQSHKGLKLGKNQEELDMEYVDFCRNNPGWKVVLYDIKILLISIRTMIRAEGI